MAGFLDSESFIFSFNSIVFALSYQQNCILATTQHFSRWWIEGLKSSRTDPDIKSMHKIWYKYDDSSHDSPSWPTAFPCVYTNEIDYKQIKLEIVTYKINDNRLISLKKFSPSPSKWTIRVLLLSSKTNTVVLKLLWKLIKHFKYCSSWRFCFSQCFSVLNFLVSIVLENITVILVAQTSDKFGNTCR